MSDPERLDAYKVVQLRGLVAWSIKDKGSVDLLAS
jgi:hypothetical protein